MTIVKIDKKWRIVLPKSLRRNVKLRQNQQLSLRIKKNSIVMTSIEQRGRKIKNDPLWNDIFRHPAHADPRKIRKIDLDKVEDEMWLP